MDNKKTFDEHFAEAVKDGKSEREAIYEAHDLTMIELVQLYLNQ